MTTYNVQIKTESGYETHSKVSSKRKADTVVRDLCSAGIQEGRVVTDKGHESQSWQIVTPIGSMIEAVTFRGPMFSGGGPVQAAEVASEWVACDFLRGDAEEWMDAGFWDPVTAKLIRDDGVTVRMAISANKRLQEKYPELFGDMSPIYAVCNSDYDVAEFVKECLETSDAE